ncbi:MAG: hypothetical protein ACE5FF_03820 [Saprospiraceae bacterium]
MKWLAMLLFCGILSSMGCGNSRASELGKLSTFPAADSAKIKAIDAYVETAKAMSDTLARETCHPNIYDSLDRYIVARKDGKYLRVLAVYYPENGEFRNDYFFKDGNLTYVYHREWTPTVTPPVAKEFFIYVENQRIIQLLGRTREFPEPNPKIPLLFEQPIIEIPLQRDSLWQVVDTDFRRVEDYLNANANFPAGGGE